MIPEIRPTEETESERRILANSQESRETCYFANVRQTEKELDDAPTIEDLALSKE